MTPEGFERWQAEQDRRDKAQEVTEQRQARFDDLKSAAYVCRVCGARFSTAEELNEHDWFKANVT